MVNQRVGLSFRHKPLVPGNTPRGSCGYPASVTNPKRARRSPAAVIRLLGVQRQLVMMSVPFVVWVVVFAYLPLAGWDIPANDVLVLTRGRNMET